MFFRAYEIYASMFMHDVSNKTRLKASYYQVIVVSLLKITRSRLDACMDVIIMKIPCTCFGTDPYQGRDGLMEEFLKSSR